MSAAKAPTVEEKEAPAQGCGGTESVPEVTSAVALPEQRVLLHGIRWETYESLLKDMESSRTPRLTYDRGALEIMSPLPDHEQLSYDLAALVEIVAQVRNLDVRGFGSTTFKRQDMERGFEPDACFYFRHAAQMRGRSRVDLTVDPPPELVIEIDMTHSTLDKLPIYAQLGVPEVWRCAGKRLSILVLRAGAYHEQEESAALPGVNGADLTALLEDALALPRPEWGQKARDWARGHRR